MERAVAWAAVLALAFGAWVLSRRPLSDYDLPWNLATGRVIAERRAIPTVDDLAFTRGTLRYVEVLGDLLLWRVDRALGATGLQWLGALVAAGCFSVTFARSRATGLVAYLMVAWLAAASVQWFTVRPASISLLLLALGLLFVDAHRQRPSEWRRLLPVVPLSFVWANIHGLVALFAGLVVAYSGISVLTAWAARRAAPGREGSDGAPRPTVRDAAAVVVLALSALAAASVNTLGPALLLGPLRSSEALGDITEWARPSLQFLVNDVPVASALFAFSTLAIVLGREPDGRRALPPFDTLVAGGAAVALCTVVRLAPVALVLVTPIAARRLATLVPRTNVVAAASAAAALAAAAFAYLTIPTTTVAGFDASRLPVAATRFVERTLPAGQMYNFMPFGGYLAYRLHPRYRVFMDGRNTLARSEELVRRAGEADTQPSVFAALVQQHALEWALTASTEGEAHDLPLARSPRWQMVYLDDVAAVYVRRDGANAALAATGYQVLRHVLDPGAILAESMRDGAAAPGLGHDGALALAQAPESPRASFLAAAGGIAARDPSLFARGVERLSRLAPAHPAVALLKSAWSARMGQPGRGAP